MKKIVLAVSGAMLLCAHILAQPAIQQNRTTDYTYTFHVRDDVPPEPLPGSEVKAGWQNFWMFDDGTFSWADTTGRVFYRPEVRNGALARRAKYSGTSEPPHARFGIPLNTETGPAPVGTLPTYLRSGQTDAIEAQWSAARPADLICLALIVRNPYDLPANGTLTLRFPSDVFDYDGQVFTDQAGFSLLAGQPVTDRGDETLEPGTMYSWSVNALAAQSERVLFVRIRVKTGAMLDTDHDLLLEWRAETTDNTSGNTDEGRPTDSPVDNPANPGNNDENRPGNNNPPNDPGVAEKAVVVAAAAPEGDRGATSAVSFRATSVRTIFINLARDPNALYGRPTHLEPRQNAPAKTITYTVHTENLGTALCRDLKVTVMLDAQLDPNSVVLGEADFPSAPKLVLSPPQVQGQQLLFTLDDINLQSCQGLDAALDSQYTRANFSFDVKTRTGIDLVAGRHIVTRARIAMFGQDAGSNASVRPDDEVDTKPDTVRVEHRCRGRIPFGNIIGLKGYTDFSASTNPASNRGLAVTWRFPLANPCGNRLDEKFLRRPPQWFWQFELGFGSGSFESATTGLRYDLRQVHFTPVQVLYYQKISNSNWARWLRFSGAYSADYTYGWARAGGGDVILPAGFGRRLEHELAGSVGVSNSVGVPGLTLGLGYKHRFNQLENDWTDYGLPFVFLQADIIRFRRGFLRVWNKTLIP